MRGVAHTTGTRGSQTPCTYPRVPCNLSPGPAGPAECDDDNEHRDRSGHQPPPPDDRGRRHRRDEGHRLHRDLRPHPLTYESGDPSPQPREPTLAWLRTHRPFVWRCIAAIYQRVGLQGAEIRPPSEPPRRAARVRGPRRAPRRSPARLRAAQAPHHRARHLPGPLVRLALPGARAARRLRLHPRDRGADATRAGSEAPTDHLRADRRRQGALPGPRRRQRSRRLGRRRLRRPLRLLLPHRGAGPPAHPRGPALPARGAPRQRPRRLSSPQPRAHGQLHPRPPAARRGARRARGPLARGAHRRRTPRGPRPRAHGIRRHHRHHQRSPNTQSKTTNNKE